ncbi:MAG: pilus assembly protein CpaF [Polyangiales bacterium]|jgi:pilus assembly protein CpaF
MIEVATHFDTSEVSARSQLDKVRRSEAKAVIAQAFEGAGIAPSDALAQAALQEAVGLGVLDAFLADESIEEILVDGPARVKIDKGQGLETSEASFSTAAALATVGRRLLAQGGHEPGTLVGVVDLPSGGTASVVLPPIAASGTIIEIRRVSLIRSEALVARGVLNTPIANMLTSAVNSGFGVVVVGPANASRDVLALLASAVPESERLVCIDAAQVSVGRSHVALTSGSGVSSSELVRQASRLRVDRLLVASVPVGDVFNVVGGAGGMGAAIIGVSAGGGIPTLELGVTLGGVPEGQTHGFLSSAVRLVVVVERVGQDARVVEVSELGAAGVSTLFHWNGSDFAAENSPSF